MKASVPFGTPPHQDRCRGQSGEREDRNRIENQELKTPEEEWDVTQPDHRNSHDEAHDHHRYDPERPDPPQPSVEIHPPFGDEDVLQQVDADPAHEQPRMQVNAQRGSEGRPPHQILERERGNDYQGHDDRGAQEEAFVARVCWRDPLSS